MRWLACICAIAIACERPDIAERSDLACSNGIDDDGDGNADCGDIDCASSVLCEISFETCRDGIDNDGNTMIDCEEERCLELPDLPCASFETDCNPVSSEGCPVGMSCRLFERAMEWITRCDLAGVQEEATACDGQSTTAPCMAGYDCTLGYCSGNCASDADCPADSTCFPLVGSAWGTCTTPCTPFTAPTSCPDGFCATLHTFSFSFIEGGAHYACFREILSSAFTGTAGEGDVCDDNVVAGLPRSVVCRGELACVPDVRDVYTCRRGCTAYENSAGFGCGECERCFPFYPLDPRTPPASARSMAGYCGCDRNRSECGCGP
jgi:hypothetical protein